MYLTMASISSEARSVQIIPRPFLNPLFHLLISNQIPPLDVMLRLGDRVEQREFFRHISEIRVIRKPLDCPENLFFNGHATTIASSSEYSRRETSPEGRKRNWVAVVFLETASGGERGAESIPLHPPKSRGIGVNESPGWPNVEAE